MTRRACRTDGNQADIVAALRRLGWTVHTLHRAGDGCPDIVISVGPGLAAPPDPKARGVLTAGDAVFVELKAAGGTLTPAQIRWAAAFRGPLIVAEYLDDVIAGVARIRAERGQDIRGRVPSMAGAMS